ncbi:hypothetical protein M422DRAFT_245312 [Sphaerobolus stellatus SS14]|nr:hypothetical protein M422DRAFT_245312 [Sphaerobolus stellatus SS14]
MPRAPMEPTGNAQTECPFCHHFFRRLTGHYAKAVLCKMKAEALQKTLLDESLRDQNNPESESEESHPASGMHIRQAGNSDEQLPEDLFPRTPNSRASKRARFTSPQRPLFSPGMHIIQDTIPGSPANVFMDIESQSEPQTPTRMGSSNTSMMQDLEEPEEPVDEPQPFEGEKVFQLYSKREFPRAGHVFSQGEQTIFHRMKADMPAGYSYFPFLNEEEWSLAEFLATSRLSKGSINAFFKTAWMWHHGRGSFKNATDFYHRIDKYLPNGPQWFCKEVQLKEAPNEPQVLFYRDPIECLQFLSQSPAFDGHQDYAPIKYFSEVELRNRVYGEVNSGDAWHYYQSVISPEETVNPVLLGSDGTHVTNFSGDGKVHPVYITSAQIQAHF